MREARRVSPAPLRRRLLLPAHAARRRPLGDGRRRRRLPRPDLLDRRPAGHAVRAWRRRRWSAPASRTATSRAGASPQYERTLKKRYHHFRRFAVGFYDPAFRDLFFTRSSRFGIYEAVLSVLAGNWRPSLGTRAAPGPVLRPGRAAARASHRGPVAQRGLVGRGAARAGARTHSGSRALVLDGGTLSAMAQDSIRDEPQEADRHHPQPRRPHPGAHRRRRAAVRRRARPRLRRRAGAGGRAGEGIRDQHREPRGGPQRLRIAGQPGRVRRAPAERVEARIR